MAPSPQPLTQPQPSQQGQKAFPVSWDQFHRDARALAWRLAGDGPFEAIVCVTRGGMVPAAIIARELGIRVIETVCVASYSTRTQGDLQVLKGVEGDRRPRRRRGRGRPGRRRPGRYRQDRPRRARPRCRSAHYATMYAKPVGRPLVDTFITEVSQDTWIYFPWDTGLAFQPPIRGNDV